MNVIIESRLVSLFTFFGTLVILSVASFMLNGWVPYYEAIVEPTNITFNPIGVCIGAVIISSLAYLFTIVYISAAIMRQNPASLMILYSKQNISITHFFGLVVLEEVIARWLCIGVLPKHMPDWYFFLLFLGGNAGFLWFKARNFLNETPHFLKLVPQFVCGLLFGYIFMQYGLFASIMTHLGCKSVLMTLHKVEDGEDKDFWAGIASVIIMLLGYCHFRYITHKNIFAIQVFADGVFEIEGWNIFDYFVVSVIFIYGTKAASLLLCYDQGSIEEDKPYSLGNKTPIPLTVMGGCFGMVIMTIVGYWLLYLIVPQVHIRVLLLTLPMAALYSPNSGSGRVRNFWTSFIVIFISVTTMEAVGWLIFACMWFHLMIQIPFRLAERLKMKESPDGNAYYLS